MSSSMFSDIPVDVGIAYEGERIRKKDMYVELGGPAVRHKFELLRIRKLEEVEDGKVRVVGPDLSELEEGKSYPFGLLIEVAGKDLEPDAEGVLERRIHEYCNFIEGFMHLNQRYDIWLRLSKKAYKKGLNSFKYIGLVLQRLFKSEFPIIEKIQVTFITDPKKVEEMWKEAIKVYEARDKRALGLKDEDVDVFYGCRLCQSFAPTHVCVITPERPANCGAITWLDARVAVKIDPKGPIFEIPKGRCLDPEKGEYEGVNEAAKKVTGGAITRVQLYTAFGSPHTSCGCFECAAFYIPEVDGLGIVHRGYTGTTPIGLKFTDIADATSGGRQVDGFHGLGILYTRTRKFLQADGGWRRIVWLASELKERIKDAIPAELVDKIATEKEATTVEELKKFLLERGHPVVERWKAVEEAKPPEKVEAPEVAAPTEVEVTLPAEGLGLPAGVGGFRIILKNVRIKADRLIIRRSGEERKG